jgi:hypothetical protein
MTEGNGFSKGASGTAGDLSTDPVPFIGTGLTGLVEMECIGMIMISQAVL